MARRSPPPPGPAVNITSLCDIMLSLLIFFMLVSKAGVETGADADLPLPIASLGITQEDYEAEQAAGNGLVINVQPGLETGNPRVYGRLIDSGKDWAFNAEDTAFLRHVEAIKGDREDFEIFIHADRNTPFIDMESVLQAVNVVRPSVVNHGFTNQ